MRTLSSDIMVDGYEKCDKGCAHDLARGVLVTDLHDQDGPYDPEQDRKEMEARVPGWVRAALAREDTRRRLEPVA